MKKILHVCEACLMLNGDDLKNTRVDRDEATLVYSIAITLDSAVEPRETNDTCHVPWPWEHSHENFDLYLSSWLKSGSLEYETDRIGDFSLEEIKKRFYSGNERDIKELKWTLLTKRLSLGGLRAVQTQFTVWAIPRVAQWAASIGRILSPDALMMSGFEAAEEPEEKEL